jgi:glyoxylase-like metal-dependent hydrolase (beta-lactamase superfamily II)
VWLTNRSHSRAAAAFRERYGLTVWAHEADADRLEAGADRTVAGRTTIAGAIEIVPVPGKSPGEIAFHLPRSGALIVGDLVIGVPPGELSTYPDEVIDDKAELQRSCGRGCSTTSSTRCCSATASRCQRVGGEAAGVRGALRQG